MESYCLMGTVSVWEDEKNLETDGAVVCTNVNIPNATVQYI